MNKKHLKAFTLIELLMVIAIIGILAGILIPTVGAVKKQGNIAASKAQLSNYVTAITLFKGEYGYYPFADAQVDGGKNINDLTDDFVETLSGRDIDGALTSSGGNRRRVGFHNFSESEFVLSDDNSDSTQIADRFANTNIFIVIDANGDNIISLPSNPDTVDSEPLNIRTSVTAYTLRNTAIGAPGYSLYQPEE